MPRVEEFIDKYFPDARYQSGEFCCRCPSHDDIRESLHITQGDESDGDGSTKILMHCKAGCTTGQILKALGAKWEEISGKDPRDVVWKKIQHYYRPDTLTDIYDYQDQDGCYLYSKLRIKDHGNGSKIIRYARIDYSSGTFAAGDGGMDHILYRLPELLRSISSGYPVYIVEGEKDVHTLADRMHYSATTAGSSGDWKKEYAQYFKGADVIILPDNDKPGRKAADRIMKDLKDYAYRMKAVTVSSQDKGDVTDYLDLEGGTPEDLRQMIADQPWSYAEWVYTERKKQVINADLLAAAIDRNEHYLLVRQPGDDRDTLYVYQHGVYVKVNRNQFIALVIRPYIPKGKATANLLDNTMRLLLTAGTHCIRYSELDKDEQIINVRNGILNIDSWTMEPHRPDLFSTIQLDVCYDPEAKDKPNFDRYIDDLIKAPDNIPDQEKAKALQEYFGMVLSNIPMYKLKRALFLISFIGNTGKSSLLRLIDSLLGEGRTAAIDLKDLDSGSGNRFMLGAMRGKRLIECGDQSSATISDSSTFKRLTGGDLQKIEEKGKQGDYFRFTGGMVIASNQIPYFADDHGKHLIERIMMIPLQHTIVDKDTGLESRMLQEKSAIFNWFLEGLKRLRRNNYRLTECGSVTGFMQEYRENNDSLYRYLTENYEITNSVKDLVSKSEFDNDYLYWCSRLNGDLRRFDRVTPVRKKNIKNRLSSYGINFTESGCIGKQRNIYCYVGIKKKEVSDGEDNK